MKPSTTLNLNYNSRFLIFEEVVVPRAGFEHATTRSSAERSPRLSYLGTHLVFIYFFGEATKSVSRLLIYVFVEY
jgi:hypothetical protein